MASEVAWAGFAGKWQVDRAENFEQFLEAMEVGLIFRKVLANVPKPAYDIKIVDGEAVTIQLITPLKSHDPNTIYINSDKESHVSMADISFKAKATFDNGRLTTQLSSDDGKILPKVTREVIGDELHETLECGSVVSKRVLIRCP